VLRPGDAAPDFELTAADGETVSLSEPLRAGRQVLLVFLRHLGWLPCREHVAQLCRHQEELEQLNVEVLIISFGALPAVQAWLEETCSPFRLLLDPERLTYRAYQLERSFSRSWNLSTIWYYARLLTTGRRWRGIQGDSAQLGADFVVDPEGSPRLTHYSHDPTHRPATRRKTARAVPHV
jgi:peroxiredoxin